MEDLIAALRHLNHREAMAIEVAAQGRQNLLRINADDEALALVILALGEP
jgi:hypothetical protein